MPLTELISPIWMGACAATGAASAVRSRRVPSVAETRCRLMASLSMVRVTVGPKHGEVKRRTGSASRRRGESQGAAPSAVPTVPTTAPRASRTSATQVSISAQPRSEEHTSELQSLAYLVCRLLLEKKKKTINMYRTTDH